MGEGSECLRKKSEKKISFNQEDLEYIRLAKTCVLAQAIHLLIPINLFCKQRLNNPALLKGSPNSGIGA